MTFKDWCRNYYGITSISNDSLFDNIFIPALSEMTDIQIQYLSHFGGRMINPPKVPQLKGLVISRQNFNKLIELLHLTHQNKEPDSDFADWVQRDFALPGLDFNRKTDERKLDHIQITFKKIEHFEAFKNEYANYIIESPLPLSSVALTLQFTSSFIADLIVIYQSSAFYTKPILADTPALQLDMLGRVLDKITHYNLTGVIDTAQILTKTDGALENTIRPKQAAEAFSLSLRCYLSLRCDSLSKEEFNVFNYTTNMLRQTHTKGYLSPCLVRDCNNVNALHTHLRNSESPSSDNPIFDELVDSHVASILYGTSSSAVALQADNFDRFLPDDNMISATNEIICQTGGVYTHFSIYRIIKVGMLLNGNRASPNDKAHCFSYYRVDYELNNDEYSPSVNVVIRRLFPSMLIEDQIQRLNIDPYSDPQRYQRGMDLTLSTLVKVERQLVFYKEPGSAESTPALFPNNDTEWQSLHAIKEYLKGDDCEEAICYIAVDSLDARLPYYRTIQNQGCFFAQDKHPLLMIFEAFISSVIGEFSTACYINFLRTHNGQQCLTAMQQKLEKCRSLVNTQSESPLNSSSGKTPDEKPAAATPTLAKRNRNEFFNDEDSEVERTTRASRTSEDSTELVVEPQIPLEYFAHSPQ